MGSDQRLLCSNPGVSYQAHKSEINAAIQRVLDSGTYILGREVADFERAFAQYCGVRHAIGVANGTDALSLALRAVGAGPGSEVITVSHTAVATVAAIIAVGATPVLVDVDETKTINPYCVAEEITSKTVAIIPVHLYGQKANISSFVKGNLWVIEDCAQAAGMRIEGDIGCFSFYPTKNLGAIGDGGAVVLNDEVLAWRLSRLRQYGWDEVRITQGVGINSRLDPIQAAILAVKLAHLGEDNVKRLRIARRYNENLYGLPVILPNEGCYHLYVIECDNRDALLECFLRNGIGFGIHYPVPVHLQNGYNSRIRIGKSGLKTTEYLAKRVFSLPMYPELELDEVDRVCECIWEFYG